MEINHQQFIKRYNNDELTIIIDENKAGDFVLSNFADKHNKPAHNFWTWTGIILILPAPIFLFFIDWKYAILCFFAGFIVHKSARKSATQFVLQNMIDNEDFFEYVLLHGGARIEDRSGNILTSAFINKMQKN